MIEILRNIRLDSNSFWIGFLAATLFWWLVARLRPLLGKAWRASKESWGTARQGLTVNAERRLRENILMYAQGLHLTAPLFSMDEIGLEPRLMVPSAASIPGQEPALEDIVSRLLPYTPDWPELAGAFSAQTLSMLEIVQGGAHLALIGRGGSGKTFSLAYLASQLARRDERMGALRNHLPVLLHAGELLLAGGNNPSPLEQITKALSNRASTLAKTRLPELLRRACEEGQAIVLIDGLDELPPDPLQEVVTFLGKLLNVYPDIQVVVAAGLEFIDGLPALGFVPLAMADWDRRRQAEFIQNWSQLWAQFFGQGEGQSIDPLLLNGWLLHQNAGLTPLEFCLKVWSAYAGDARGASAIDAIEAYLRRLTLGIQKGRSGLEYIAAQSVLMLRSTFSQSEANSWMSAFDKSFAFDKSAVDNSTAGALLAAQGTENYQPLETSIGRIVPDLVRSGLLVDRSAGQIGFVNPVITAYLAARSLAGTGSWEAIFSQPEWDLKALCLHYLAGHIDLSWQAQQLALQNENPSRPGILVVARWLRDLPEQAEWRKPILQQLTGLLQQEAQPMGLRVRMLAALANANDPGVATLFRHLLKFPQPVVRMLAALGSGFVRDMQAVGDLVNLLNDYPNVGQAACLALVNIGTKPAVEAVASALLHGDEDLRRAAAEAFATQPGDGHAILREGVEMDDILVRRSVIAGLWRVREPWAYQILAEMQIEDAQWVVRNAAAQAYEDLNKLNPHVPRRIVPLEDVPWLIAYAGELGVGIAPGQPALEMLNRAMREGKPIEQLAALDQVRWRGNVQVFPHLFNLLYGSDPEMREAAYNTLWHLSLTGGEIPPPAQFGLGLPL